MKCDIHTTRNRCVPWLVCLSAALVMQSADAATPLKVADMGTCGMCKDSTDMLQELIASAAMTDLSVPPYLNGGTISAGSTAVTLYAPQLNLQLYATYKYGPVIKGRPVNSAGQGVLYASYAWASLGTSPTDTVFQINNNNGVLSTSLPTVVTVPTTILSSPIGSSFSSIINAVATALGANWSSVPVGGQVVAQFSNGTLAVLSSTGVLAAKGQAFVLTAVLNAKHQWLSSSSGVVSGTVAPAPTGITTQWYTSGPLGKYVPTGLGPWHNYGPGYYCTDAGESEVDQNGNVVGTCP
jgi:hypothetical protein